MMNMQTVSRGIGVLLASASATATAWAQDVTPQSQSGAESGIEEIIVTAQKRSENIQDVPIAITAFTAAALQSRGVTDVGRLSALTPNVNLEAGAPFSGSSSVLSASIRGVGQDDFAFNLDPGVGVYVDGVYFARTVGANQNLLDVERVEILKGPQGTLFGRNTIGGAISVVTRTPGDKFTAAAQATLGRYARHDLQFSADVPISDRLLSTISLSSLDRKGYQKRIPFPSTTPFVADPVTGFVQAGYEAHDRGGGQNAQTLRAKLLWKAGDAIDVTLTGDWTHQDQEAMAQNVAAAGPSAGSLYSLYNTCISLDPATLASFGLGIICSNRATVGTSLAGANLNPATTRLLYTGTAQFDTGNIDTTYATGPNFDKLDSYGGALTIDWDLGPAALKSITGYRKLNWKVGIDQDNAPLVGIELSFHERQHQLSQEFQLTGKALNDRLNYVLGLYYFNEAGFIHDYVVFPAGLFQADGNTLIDTTSYAAFARAEFALTNKLSVTLGGRYTIEHKQLEGFGSDLNQIAFKISGCFPASASASLIGGPANLTCQQFLGYPDPNDPTRVYPLGVNKQKFNVFNPTAGLKYEFNDDVMSYLTYSKGFKSGGWTTRLTAPEPVAPKFGPEKADTYELGLKSSLLNRHLILNVAGFYTRYKGIQLNFYKALSPTLQNGGNATIKGVEVEMQAMLSDRLSLSANVGYMDAHYTSVNPLTGLTLANRLPKTPEWKFNLSPAYDMPLSNGAKLRFMMDYTHTSSLYNDAINTLVLKRPNTDQINASASYVSQDERYQITLGGTNLTDERYITTGSANGALASTSASYNAPTEWYLSFRAKI